MPLFELESSARGRRRVFARAQLPFFIGNVFVALVVALAAPDSFVDPFVLLGFAVITVATAAAWFVPWERFAPDWLILVAVADIVGVALMRTELLAVLPSASMLAIFPILWLAYGFRRWAIAVAIAGALFITSLAFVSRGSWPSSLLDWANVITLPVIIVGVAIVVNIAAAQLRRNRQRLMDSLDDRSRALRQSQDDALLQRAIFETVNAGVAFYGADNRPVVANKLAHDLVGLVGFELDRPPYAGDDVLMADRETPIPHDEQIIPRSLRGEEIRDHVEWLGPVDRQIAIMASSRRVHRDDGELLGTVIVAYDITELADAIAIREEFLSTVSHELRTPLTGMAGYLELLEDSIDPADAVSAAHLGVVSRATDRLVERVDELRAATTSTAPLDLSPTSIDSVLDEAVERSTRAADEREQILEVDHEGESGVLVLADAPKLVRAIDEVIDNAIKFSPRGSMIRVSLSVSGAEVSITIADEGPGISRGEMTQVFDRFYRTEYARSHAIQGFGLGLALAKDVVSAHGGRIAIESEERVGTRVRVSLRSYQ
ncbi:sensor histidine kinase [Agromyces atrinae]|uniref:Sensor-like histidine kinase SenX3 n=1 Tax=Agromyces atrinae TaxID=592376 RepID=A0A4V1R2T9_9MICO|nr:ATP-binding protein [Agromyces atrinae]NYD67459.1 signal transduction histidine kinase [Agromyces atrinae]RXZ88316.1 PAS domain-containing sensor histidine kinase [Agromyces atrinae]